MTCECTWANFHLNVNDRALAKVQGEDGESHSWECDCSIRVLSINYWNISRKLIWIVSGNLRNTSKSAPGWRFCWSVAWSDPQTATTTMLHTLTLITHHLLLVPTLNSQWWLMGIRTTCKQKIKIIKKYIF